MTVIPPTTRNDHPDDRNDLNDPVGRMARNDPLCPRMTRIDPVDPPIQAEDKMSDIAGMLALFSTKVLEQVRCDICHTRAHSHTHTRAHAHTHKYSQTHALTRHGMTRRTGRANRLYLRRGSAEQQPHSAREPAAEEGPGPRRQQSPCHPFRPTSGLLLPPLPRLLLHKIGLELAAVMSMVTHYPPYLDLYLAIIITS